MYLSRIYIENFRNFSKLDVQLDGNVVVVGENRVGKSNLLHTLRLIFDPTLSDNARQLNLSDFWDGLEELSVNSKIIISVEIKEFEEDLDILALLTDYRLDDDPHTVRLTYEFRPIVDLDGDPASDNDFEFICYGGENESKRFGHDLRRRIEMEVLPALRDAEGDLAVWRRSPLRPLIDNAFGDVDREELQEISEAIEDATARITEFDEVKSLEDSIRALFKKMSGSRQDVKPCLGFSASDATRLHRNIRLLIDEGLRSVNEASLGSANIIFLTLKILQLQHMINQNRRDYTFLAIEEPESHLHPHLQRSIYRHLFESLQDGNDKDNSLSVFLTTHSPHIASVAPLRSILLLKDTANSDGTIGCSTASISLTKTEVDDLTRYIDVTRAELLFARGVILVEGDAERFLVPAFSDTIGIPLDYLGISICSVSGTNFHPYVKLLIGLGIPFSIITDWDPQKESDPLGVNRADKLIREIEQFRSGEISSQLVKSLEESNGDEFCDIAVEYGIFLNDHTLEVDLFKAGFGPAIINVLRSCEFGPVRKSWIDQWDNKPEKLDTKKLLSLINSIGKGRFAQRLVSHIDNLEPPEYISKAIRFVADHV